MTEQYRVEKIIDKRITNGKNYYKIKWLHYPEDQCTWEPERHLSTCKDLIKKFNDNLSKLQQTKQNETTAKSLDYNPQKTPTNTKSGTQKGKVKQSTKRIRRQEEQSESERIFQEEQKSQSSDGKFKRPLPSKLKKGPPARKTANNHSFRIQNDQESQYEDDLIQEKPKLSPQIIPQAKTSKLSEGAKVEVLGMVQIDKQKYFRISQNGTIREISREQLISQDPIALVHFYQRNIRFLPSK